MERYTLLLVDDEEEVVQIIMKKISWEEIGFSVIGHANNGVKALEMVEEYQPDVVITDIKMPYMDGMELAKRIKAGYPDIKILFFTGFDEFEYAREAIHLEVEEYILKPLNAVELTEIFEKLKTKLDQEISFTGFDEFEYAREAIHLEVEEYILKPLNAVELTEIFEKLKTKLDQEISEKRNAEILQKYYMESLPLLQVNFYSTLIEGRLNEEEIPKYLSDYQIFFTGPYYCCLVIHTSSSQNEEGMSPQLLITSVQKQAEERLEEKWQAKSFSYLGNTVLLAQLSDRKEVSELTDECDRFCKYAGRIIGAVVTIGIGPVCEKISELSESYSGAREAVSYRVLYGASRAINMQEIAPREITRQDFSNDTELSNLFKMIRLSSREDILEAADAYLRKLSSPERSMQQHHVAVMELVSALYRFGTNQDIVVEELCGDIGSLYGKLMEMEPEMLGKWLKQISLVFQERIIHARYQSTNSFIVQAKEYVKNHYKDEDLSLDSVCQELGVSNSYFSTIFKKEEGTSFIGYLTDYRMEKASRMLIETKEKSYIIARQVGYTDANYFSYVFKRRFGVSPSKYRTEYAKQ